MAKEAIQKGEINNPFGGNFKEITATYKKWTTGETAACQFVEMGTMKNDEGNEYDVVKFKEFDPSTMDEIGTFVAGDVVLVGQAKKGALQEGTFFKVYCAGEIKGSSSKGAYKDLRIYIAQ